MGSEHERTSRSSTSSRAYRDALAPSPAQKAQCRWAHDVIEHPCPPHEQRKADDLEPFEGLPAQTEADQPNEQRAAGVDCTARRGGDVAGDAEAEEVKATRSQLVSGL